MITTKKVSLKIYIKGNEKKIKAAHTQNINTKQGSIGGTKGQKGTRHRKESQRQK